MKNQLKHLDATSLDERDDSGLTFSEWLESAHFERLVLWAGRQASDAANKALEAQELGEEQRQLKAISVLGMHFLESRMRSLHGYLVSMRTPKPTNPRYTTSR